MMTDQLDDDEYTAVPPVEEKLKTPPLAEPVIATQSALAKANIQAQDKVRIIMPTTPDECYRLAECFYLADMIPKGLSGKSTDRKEIIARATIAIMHGSEVGFGPVTSVGTIMVVNNKATIYGDGAKALVLRSGVIEYEKCEISGSWAEKTFKVTIRMKRWDQKEEAERSFGYDDAKRAGLIGKGGADAPWTKYPERQTYWRAWSWAARDTASDALKGLAVFEEVSDYEIEQRRLHDKTDTSSLEDVPASPQIEHQPDQKEQDHARQS